MQEEASTGNWEKMMGKVRAQRRNQREGQEVRAAVLDATSSEQLTR